MEWLDLQRFVVSVLDRLGIQYFITGSTATMFFGETRFTNDLDVVIDLRPAQVPALVASFDPEEFYVSADAVRQALAFHGQFNVITPDVGLQGRLHPPGPQRL